IPSYLCRKLQDLRLNSSLCQWILDFLTERPQVVRIENPHHPHSPSSLKGCVLSPLLYSLYSSDCTSMSNSNTLVKSADDTVVVAYLGEVENLAAWCQANNLSLNVVKTKEMIVDFGRKS
ncbi:hypothetical protein LDENG_00279690, partial [Lucifuga dentata]